MFYLSRVKLVKLAHFDLLPNPLTLPPVGNLLTSDLRKLHNCLMNTSLIKGKNVKIIEFFNIVISVGLSGK